MSEFHFPANDDYRAMVVIPTVCGDPLMPSVVRLVEEAKRRHVEGLKPIVLVLAINSPKPKEALDVAEEISRICAASDSAVKLIVYGASKPIGFGAANNRGLIAGALELGGLPKLTIFLNDDAHVSDHWIERMLGALETKHVNGFSEPWNAEDPNSHRPARAVEGYGRIGMVGPVSNLVAGIQQLSAVAVPGGIVEYRSATVDQFATVVAERYRDQRVTADFISGFCVGFHRDLVNDLLLVAHGGHLFELRQVLERNLSDGIRLERNFNSTPEILELSQAHRTALLVGIWDEETYPIAGYEDNDICVRTELLGWRCIVANDCFVGHLGHQTFDRLFPEAQRGLRNRMRYYRKWRWLTSPVGLQIIGAYRLRFEVAHDLALFRTSVQRAAQLLDGIAVVLTSNPAEIKTSGTWEEDKAALRPEDAAFIDLCEQHDANPEVQANLLRTWIAKCIAEVPNHIGTDPEAIAAMLSVRSWIGQFNERDERNASHLLAEKLDADWIMSIDHDETIENRIDRALIERWCKHPDPLVRALDQAWVNHWDHGRLVREDPPWGDGGSYVGGMHGFRLWRVSKDVGGENRNRAKPRRIMAGTENGLHCGNSPDHDLLAKRVSGLRFRHFGPVRVNDRHRKYRRYREQDKNPDPMLTGNPTADPYGHLIHEEGMRMSPFVPINGIGLHCLIYEKVSVDEVARMLDQMYTLADRIVLVWTGDWALEDRSWLAPVPSQMAERIKYQENRRNFWHAWMQANPGQTPPSEEPPRMRGTQKALVAAFEDPELLNNWPSTGPSREIAEVCALFGVEWVHEKFDDSFAKSRNAGLEALAANANGIGWSLFFDWDEIFTDTFGSLVALRRMAECSDAVGWLFQFANHHTNQQPTHSESVRMARLLPGVEFNGRVHETFDLAMARLGALGQKTTLRIAPFDMHNLGLQSSQEELAKKFRRYQRLLIAELEDNPYNSQAWVSLAMHFFNDNLIDKGEECLKRALACAGNAYLAYSQNAFHHLRIGTAMLHAAIQRVGPGHGFRRANAELCKLLQRNIPAMPILGRGPNDPPICDDVDLPEFTISPEQLVKR